MSKRLSTRAGFALMAALFIIVTLAAIAVYLLTISTGQVAAVTQDEQAARAYQAARTGIEWGAYQILRNSAVGFGSSCTSGGSASQTLSLGDFGTGSATVGYFADVTCTRVATETESGVAVSVFRLWATGCNRSPCTPAPAVPADALYVERQLQLTLAK